MYKNGILFFILCSSVYSLSGMEQEQNNQEIERKLFEDFFNKVNNFQQTDQTHFMKCLNIVTNKTIDIKLNNKGLEHWSVDITGTKSPMFDITYLKLQLTQLYKKQSSLYKISFEEQGKQLGMAIGEDEKNIIISMYLKNNKIRRKVRQLQVQA